MKLFDISSEFFALNQLIDNDLEFDENTGEVTDNSETLKELFYEISASLEDKFENIQRYIQTLQGEEDILDNEIKRLQYKKQVVKNKTQRLKDLMLATLENTRMSKFKTPLYSFSIRESKSVDVKDVEQLPLQFVRVKKEADKTQIKKAIDNGEKISGASIVINKSLQVK